MARCETLHVACIQLCSGLDVASNVRMAADLVREAADKGAQYVLTPENTALMDEDKDRVRALVGTMDTDAAVRAFSELAEALGIWLHIGSLALRSDEPESKDSRLVNRSLLFTPQGRLHAWYDKIHLFDVVLNQEKAYRESAYIRPGNEAVLTDVLDWPLGMSICYDVRFPTLYRHLAKAGAIMFSVPAAFTVPTGQAHWHVLLRARAIENAAWILAAAQGGVHESGRRTYGHSVIVSPWGEVVAECETEPGVIYWKLAKDAVEETRARIPVLEHERAFRLVRRPEVSR